MTPSKVPVRLSTPTRTVPKPSTPPAPEEWDAKVLPGRKATLVFLDGKALPVQVLGLGRYTVVATAGARLLLVWKHALKYAVVEAKSPFQALSSDGDRGGGAP